MGFTGIPRALAEWVGAFPAPALAAHRRALTVFFVILGCFLDGISMIVLTTSVIMPLIDGAGLDRIWFASSSSSSWRCADHAAGRLQPLRPAIDDGAEHLPLGLWALPFFLMMVVMVALLWLVPDLALWLPRTMLDGPR